MKIYPFDIPADEVRQWIKNPTANPVEWELNPGTPSNIRDIFDSYVKYSVEPDSSVSISSNSIDYYAIQKEAQMLVVSLTNVAEEAHRLHEEAVALGLRSALAEQLEAHSASLIKVRDQLHHDLLTKNDIANGAVPQKDRSAGIGKLTLLSRILIKVKTLFHP